MRYSDWCPGLDAGSPVAGPGRLAFSTAWRERGGVVRRCTSVPAWRHALEAPSMRSPKPRPSGKQAETAPNGANDRLNELERDLDEARAAGTLPAVPGMRPGRFLVSHVPRIVVERGRSGAATTEHEQRRHARPRSTTPSGGPAGSQRPPPRPSSTGPQAPPSGSGPRARDATTRPSSFTRRRSSAQPPRPSRPACPALKSPGSTSSCWSSPVAAAAPGAPVRLLQGVLAAARRSPRYAPVDCWRRPPAELPDRGIRRLKHSASGKTQQV